MREREQKARWKKVVKQQRLAVEATRSEEEGEHASQMRVAARLNGKVSILEISRL